MDENIRRATLILGEVLVTSLITGAVATANPRERYALLDEVVYRLRVELDPVPEATAAVGLIKALVSILESERIWLWGWIHKEGA